MAALVVLCEVRGREAKAAPHFGVRRLYSEGVRPASSAWAGCVSPDGVYPAPPASIYMVTDGDICGKPGLLPAPYAAISRYSTTIPGHSWCRVGMTGGPYRGPRPCLTMASARKNPDKRFPCKANGEPGNSSPAAVLTFMAKGACS
jgi:hypothetical protein